MCKASPCIRRDSYAIYICLKSSRTCVSRWYVSNSGVCFPCLQLQCVSAPSQLRQSADMQGFYFCQMLDHNAAIQQILRGRKSGHRNKTTGLANFQNEKKKLTSVYSTPFFAAQHHQEHVKKLTWLSHHFQKTSNMLPKHIKVIII